ncbi:MAG: IS66 family insertion sequence element accessory protein TnpB [Deltaproteobacteria bacterium]|nr:IS66 family insertion sequence element accessory protein TnpB [Deltaproteobacteria bacterium]
MGHETRGQQWAARVARWERSGLTRAAFAARERVNPRTLSFWKWKLRSAAPTATAGAPAQAVTFVELVGATPSPPALEVVLPAGYRIGVASGFDAATLRTLLTVLEAPR